MEWQVQNLDTGELQPSRQIQKQPVLIVIRPQELSPYYLRLIQYSLQARSELRDYVLNERNNIMQSKEEFSLKRLLRAKLLR